MGVEVWWSSLTAADGDALTLLDATERARLDALDSPADRGRSLVGAALLRVAVAARLGVDPRDVAVDRTCVDCGRPHGAPRVVGPEHDDVRRTVWVSVSHSGLLVVVALGDAPVGVDVQREADLRADAPAWARHEAEVKLHGAVTARGGLIADAPDATTTPLATPLAGYAAALATAGVPGAVVVRHWPGPDGGPVGDADDGTA
ncbi:4'-phosphopantetheinyl transferase family protein [Cellulomonas carbonis]|uniref:4-phosphopantetheinyl transferase n=1 Tax=Cellulomonas carbonis T26 TaxID=947969 RepID=A0A0A0BQ35_9CELL|nr:hypothetical protein [Cellulomonas carbonis]KGM09727.1 4-phosphopantetheinyl transferase [Cellulomonas carbonis T26]GGB99992.1 hypothetical protein GCM10010972_10960 [Cellulomonas carbonis]